MKVISEYCNHSAKLGSVYIDNGVHQSYTSIPRIKELYEVSGDLHGTDFKLVYNREKNYFSSVIITKETDYGSDFWNKYLDRDHVLVALQEANRATFFRLEYFIRTFIISNFKNNSVFRDFNDMIVDTLRLIMEELGNNKKENIPKIILHLINHIARNYTNDGVHYNEITLPILDSYDIDGEDIYTILERDIYTPKWMNIHANRDN